MYVCMYMSVLPEANSFLCKGSQAEPNEGRIGCTHSQCKLEHEAKVKDSSVN
jgi:hypothetical protein